MNDTIPPQPPVSRRKLAIGGATALVAAAAIAVVFVLPAEFGMDPTGLGKALGLNVLSEPGMSVEQQRGAKRKGVLAPLPGQGVADPLDRYSVTLAPFESIEMKYTLAEGAQMPFAWAASAPVDYDMHAHPFDGGTELTESYSVTKAASQSGLYTAQFSGIHGWFWQNRNMDNVTLTLDAGGAITGSRTFDQFGEHPREFSPPAPAPAGR